MRVNGEVEASNVSGNWRPEALFDRLNGDNQWMAGEVLFYPRVMMLSEKQKIEGYLAEKWNLQSGLPSGHPYKSSKPLGQAGLVINGIPEKAGSYSVNVTGTNKWGQASEVFNITVLPQTPETQTVEATQVGSTSARLQANIFDLGGADGNLSLFGVLILL